MTRHIYLDRAEGGGFTVRVLSGLRGDRTYAFAEHAQGAAFAERKMGRARVLLDTTTITQAQLAEHRAREAHTAALLTKPVP